jgi:hypothetical protein
MVTSTIASVLTGFETASRTVPGQLLEPELRRQLHQLAGEAVARSKLALEAEDVPELQRAIVAPDEERARRAVDGVEVVHHQAHARAMHRQHGLRALEGVKKPRVRVSSSKESFIHGSPTIRLAAVSRATGSSTYSSWPKKTALSGAEGNSSLGTRKTTRA